MKAILLDQGGRAIRRAIGFDRGVWVVDESTTGAVSSDRVDGSDAHQYRMAGGGEGACWIVSPHANGAMGGQSA